MSDRSIFLVEDSDDFAFAIRRVWSKVSPDIELVHFPDTVSAMAELLERAKTDRLPMLVLLDLNMKLDDVRAEVLELCRRFPI